jgi:branched-chain amino acid transport system ATP-binding protein
VNLRVARNEVVSLLGRNGSGRSTTMKAIMGLVAPTAGHIRLQGRELAGARPYAICRAGIGYVPEEREVFANLTVDENLRMGEQRPCPARTAGPSSRCSTTSRGSRSGATPRPAACRAASSRC